MRIDEYLDSVCGEIRWKAARRQVRDEMRAHIEQRAEEYANTGDTKEQAEEKAVAGMGDAAKTGRELDRLHRPRYDWVLVGALAVLLILGLSYEYSPRLDYAHKNLVWVLSTVSGFTACCSLAFVNFRKLFTNRIPSLGLYLFCLAVVITVGYLNRIEDPEGPKTTRDMIVSLCAAGMVFSVGLWARNIKSSKHFMVYLAAILAGVIALFAVPAFPVAFPFIICSWIILWTIRFKHSRLAVCVVTCAALCYMLLMLAAYRWWISTPFDIQIRRFLESYTDPAGHGYLMDQARRALSSLNLFGPGNPIEGLYNPIPYADSNYGLIGFMQMYGLAAGLAVIGLTGVVLWRIVRILLSIQDNLGKTVSLGLCAFVTIQIILYLLINFGVLPNLVQSAIPMFCMDWSTPLELGSVLGILLGLYRMKDACIADHTIATKT